MPKKLEEWIQLLEKGQLDTSEVILVAMAILDKKKEFHGSYQYEIDMHAIKEHYLFVEYPAAVTILFRIIDDLEEPELKQKLQKALINANKYDIPEHLESRRYFENTFFHKHWTHLNTPSHKASITRLAKFICVSNPEYAQQNGIDTIDKVHDVEEMKRVIASIRDFYCQTVDIREKEQSMRGKDTAISQMKDRGHKRADPGYTMNPGVVKAHTPMPKDELREKAIKEATTDSFVIDRSKEFGYSATNIHKPFGNSLSGTTYGLAAVLLHYIKDNEDSETLQQDLINIVDVFGTFTGMEGYHPLMEILDVLHSNEVMEEFHSAKLQLYYNYSGPILDWALERTIKYLEVRQGQKSVLKELPAHSLFKGQVATPKGAFPRQLALFVNEELLDEPQSTSLVLETLQTMHRKGLSGEKKYSTANCIKLAQQYLHYIELNQPHLDGKSIRKFIKDLSTIETETDRTQTRPHL